MQRYYIRVHTTNYGLKDDIVGEECDTGAWVKAEDALKLEAERDAALKRERVLRGMLIHPLPNGETDVGGNGTWIGRYQTYQAAESALDAAVKEKGGAK